MAKDVYVSYLKENMAISNQLSSYLDPEVVFLKHNDIDEDEYFAYDQQFQAIKEAKFLIAILSEKASTNPMILNEIKYAKENETQIISFLIEDFEPSGEITKYLEGTHVFEVYKGGLIKYLQELEDLVKK